MALIRQNAKGKPAGSLWRDCSELCQSHRAFEDRPQCREESVGGTFATDTRASGRPRAFARCFTGRDDFQISATGRRPVIR